MILLSMVRQPWRELRDCKIKNGLLLCVFCYYFVFSSSWTLCRRLTEILSSLLFIIMPFKSLQIPNSEYQIDYILTLKIIKKMLQPKRRMKSASGVRDFSVCSNERILLAVVYDIIRIYDVYLGAPILSVKLDTSPRLAKLAPNGSYFIVYESNNYITVYDTLQGTILQKICDVPASIKTIRISTNSQKLIFASTQILCLWNVRSCSLEIRTQNWKNINCYDVSQKGQQFAIGTYNGIIYVLSYLGQGKCTQIQIKRHKNCITAISFHKDKIVSVSYDGHLLISALSTSAQGQRTIAYNEMRVSYVPRDIESVGENFYMMDHRGITWFTPKMVLVGFVDSKMYRPFVGDGDGELTFVKLAATEFEWWPGRYVMIGYGRNGVA